MCSNQIFLTFSYGSNSALWYLSSILSALTLKELVCGYLRDQWLDLPVGLKMNVLQIGITLIQRTIIIVWSGGPFVFVFLLYRFYILSETGKQFTSHLNRTITEWRETFFSIRECNPSLLCANTRNLSVKWKMSIQYVKGKFFHFAIFQSKLIENKRNEQCRNITAFCGSDK